MDGRFYVMSLAAIFLALALGILLGVHLPGAEALLVSEERLVSGIERELARLREDRAVMRRELDEVQGQREELQRELDGLMSLAASSSLDGIRLHVLPVDPERRGESLQRVYDLLKKAGAYASGDDMAADVLLHPSGSEPDGLSHSPRIQIEVDDGAARLLITDEELTAIDIQSAAGRFQLLQKLKDHLAH